MDGSKLSRSRSPRPKKLLNMCVGQQQSVSREKFEEEKDAAPYRVPRNAERERLGQRVWEIDEQLMEAVTLGEGSGVRGPAENGYHQNQQRSDQGLMSSPSGILRESEGRPRISSSLGHVTPKFATRREELESRASSDAHSKPYEP